jgi:hypothetical protein
MKISERQAHMLLRILYESCTMIGHFAGFNQDQRLRLFNDIMAQQSNKPVELDKDKEND